MKMKQQWSGSLLVVALLQLLSGAVWMCYASECKNSKIICIRPAKGIIDDNGRQIGITNCDKVSQQLDESVMKTVSNCTTILFQTQATYLNINFILQSMRDIELISNETTRIICKQDNEETNRAGAGLTFMDITGLTMSDITLSGCGVRHYYSSQIKNVEFRSAVYIRQCTNVLVSFVNLTNSTGKGISMFDCCGEVKITNTSFKGNKEPAKNLSGGGGLHIEMEITCKAATQKIVKDKDDPNNLSAATYNIGDCKFVENIVFNHFIEYQVPQVNISRGGGGLAVLLKGSAFGNNIIIDNVNVIRNKALFGYGGGVFIVVMESASNNTITVQNSMFSGNEAMELAGGSLNVGLQFQIKYNKDDIPQNNKMVFFNLNIQNNKAKEGGGGTLFSSVSPVGPLGNTFEFFNCTWYNNSASFGSALRVATVQFGASTSVTTPSIYFTDCNFTHNRVSNVPKFEAGSTLHQNTEGVGTVFISSFTIHLNGSNFFSNNTGSAVYALESVLRITENSYVSFTFNKECMQGGAIRLIGLSSIQLGDRTSLDFINNSASSSGGAIFAYNTDIASSRTRGLCFIQYIDTTPKLGKIHASLRFEGNHVTRSPHQNTHETIFVSSLQPCARLCHDSISSEAESLQCIANVSISNEEGVIATEGTFFTKTEKNADSYILVPGKSWKLPLTLKNELGHQIFSPLLCVTVIESNITISQFSTSDQTVTVYGKPGETGKIKIETIYYHNVSVTLSISLSQCPPGFIFDTNKLKCVCSVNKDNTTYNGIFDCNVVTFNAQLYLGYWIGYIDHSSNCIAENGTEDNLYVGTCPLGFCGGSFMRETTVLPNEPNGTKLNLQICGENRHGILCGECTEGHSVFFHSPTYKCGSNKLCHLGILFYLLSEIVPVTVIFCTAIICRLDVTSGYLNGFILFAQVLDSFSLLANGGVSIESRSQRFMFYSIKLVYSPFNLDFFYIEGLSFCLFKNADFLQIVLMKLVSLMYSLILIIVLICLMKWNYCYRLRLAWFRLRIANSSSLLDGIAAFLILCYSQCCRNCFQILNMSLLQGKGLKNDITQRVFRMGSLVYSDKYFLGYAIVAGFFLVVFVFLLPFILITQPLAYKFLPNSFFENRRVKAICVNIEKLKPFFDTLQGCFKDEHRYFAGIYLLYRSLPNMLFAWINARFFVYILIQACVTLMLAIHCWVQPYRKNIHNSIDTAIFFNMLLINLITIHQYFLTRVLDFTFAFTIAGYIQLILVYIPAIFFLLSLLAYLIICKKSDTAARFLKFLGTGIDQQSRDRHSTLTMLRGLDSQEEYTYRKRLYNSISL